MKNRCWLMVIIAAFLWISNISWTQETDSDWQDIPSGPRVIRAQAFVLENDQGKIRGIMQATAKGSEILLYDEKGEAGIWLKIEENIPELLLFDENGKLRIKININNKAEPGIIFYGQEEQAILLAILKETSGLAIRDENGKYRIILNLTEKGPTLGLYDKKDNLIEGMP